ncbi:MAG: hypothetical protein GX922_07090 [Firmicutes bacterium]|nr:hypothetical protein [Bacillota bacterium]
MDLRIMVIIILILLLFTGCTATITELQAAEDIAVFYEQLSPAKGSIELLATSPYRSNLLVLIKYDTLKEVSFADLLLVGKNGVLSVASVPITEKMVLNKIIYNKNQIIYGSLPVWKENNETEPADDEVVNHNNYEEKKNQIMAINDDKVNGTAVITLSNWKIIEEDVTITRGFILVLDQKSSAETIKLYNESKEILVQYRDLSKGKVQETEFIPVNELPLPTTLQSEEIEDIQFCLNLEAKDEHLVTCEKEVWEDIIELYNSCYPQLTRAHLDSKQNQKIGIIIRLQNDRTVQIVQNHNDLFNIIWQKGSNFSFYSVTSEEFKKLFTKYKELF